jgi:CBS domain-containing protein
MLPLSEYAVVGFNSTLAEAIDVLKKAQPSGTADRHPHRAVLVRGESGTIVGKVGHLAFLRALLPEKRTWSNGEMLERAGVSDDMMDSSAGVFGLLGDDIVDVCERARSIRVCECCSPDIAKINHDASLLDATRAFLEHNTLSLLVVDKNKTLGILRLTDLFDEYARQIASNDCEHE